MRMSFFISICFFVLVNSCIFASQQANDENAQIIEMSEGKAHFLAEQKKEKTERENDVQRSTCCNRSLARDCGKGIIVAALIGAVVYGLNEFGKAISPSGTDSQNVPSTNTTSFQPQPVSLNSVLPSVQSRMLYKLMHPIRNVSRDLKNKRDKRHYFLPASNKKSFNSKKKS